MHSKLIIEARDFALNAHRSTNHLYDGQPYEMHLESVVFYAELFQKFIEREHETVIAAAWLHDTIEDCRVTYNDILNVAGYNVAEIVYALTNEKGKNRKERANDKYYKGILAIPDASYLKICDRIANVNHSYVNKSKMIQVYRKEMDKFARYLFQPKYQDMFHIMETMMAPELPLRTHSGPLNPPSPTLP